MRFGKPEKTPRAQRTRGKVPEQPHSTPLPRPLQAPGLGAESGITFDPVDGHRHDGSGSHTVAYSDLTGRGHSLTGADHTISGTEGQVLVIQAGGSSGAFEAPGAHLVLAGVLASRPAFSAVPAGTLYLATDDNGGSLWRCSGSAWVPCGAAVSHDHALTALSLSGATDGHLLLATSATSYGLEALSARVSRSGAGSPNGSVSGLAGAYYLNTSDNTFWRCAGGTTWVQVAVAGGSFAPVGAQYVTGAADGTLTNELVLGTGVVMAGAGAPSSPSLAGRLYWDTTNKRLYRDTGGAWVDLQRNFTDLAVSGQTVGNIAVATSATAYALQAPGTTLFTTGAGAPSASLAAGCLYWDSTNRKLYRTTGGGTWVELQQNLADLAVSGQTTGNLLVVTGASSYALQAPGTTFFTTGAGAPSATTAAGCLYYDSTNMKLYRSSGGGVWVAVAALTLLGLSVSGRTDGELMMATGTTSYSFEALTSRVSRSGTGTPNGAVAGLPGALYLDTSSNALYRCTSGTAWVAISPAGGTGAPVGAQYVTLAADGTLTNEAVLGSAVIMAGAGAPSSPGTAGRLYWDTTNFRLYRDSGAAWVQLQPKVNELTLSGATAGQLLVASGASTYGFEAPGTRVIQRGTLAARPAATAVPAGTLYFVTDSFGGALGRSDGTSWDLIAAPVVAGGDLTGSTTAARVTGIQGKPVNGAPAVGTGDNLKGLYYSSSSSQWEYAQRAFPVPNIWRKADIGGAGTTYGAMPGAEGYDTDWVCPYDCYVVGLSITLTGDVGTAGQSYSCMVYQSPNDTTAYSATTVEATIAGGATTERTGWVRDVAVFCPGGTRLAVYDKRVGALPARSARPTIWIALAE